MGLAFYFGTWAGTKAHGVGTGSHTIPYSGYLEIDGNAVHGPQIIEFSLYDAAVDGNELWTEPGRTESVWGGRFTTVLGREHQLEDHVLNAPALYLAISVNGTPLEGRTQLGSAPFARRGALHSDFIVDGELRFRGKCIANGRFAANTTISSGGNTIGPISYGRVFAGVPAVMVTPECTDSCPSFRESGMAVRGATGTDFRVELASGSAGAVITTLNWIAIGTCN